MTMYARTMLSFVTFTLIAMPTDGAFVFTFDNDTSQIHLTDDKFHEFYQCLCSKTSHVCEFVKYMDAPQNDKTHRNGTESKTDMATYKCDAYFHPFVNVLTCQRQYASLKRTINHTTFGYRNITECDFNCIGITGGQGIRVLTESGEQLESCHIPYQKELNSKGSNAGIEILILVLVVVLTIAPFIIIIAVGVFLWRKINTETYSVNELIDTAASEDGMSISQMERQPSSNMFSMVNEHGIVTFENTTEDLVTPYANSPVFNIVGNESASSTV